MLTFACSPEAEQLKRFNILVESEKDEPKDDDIEILFENIENYLGAPAPCKIFACRSGTPEKPSLFWRLWSGSCSGTKTDSKEDANMQMWRVKVTIPFRGDLCKNGVLPSADFTEASRMDDQVRKLKPNVEPDSEVVVIVPMLVNHRAIDARSKFLLHKVAAEAKETKEKDITLDVVQTWHNKRKELLSNVDRSKCHKKTPS